MWTKENENNNINSFVPPLFSSKVKLAKAAIQVNKIYERILPILSDRLNKIHKRNYSLTFWKRTMSMSLIQNLTLIHRKFYQLHDHFNPQNFEFQILDRRCYYCPSDYSDFRNLVQLSWFGQEQIFSIYVNYFFQGNHKVFDANYTPYSIAKPKVNHTDVTKIKIGLMGCFFASEHTQKLINKSNNSIGLIHIPRLNPDSIINLHKRKQLAKPEANMGIFENFFLASLEFLFPKNLLEDFEFYEKNLEEKLNSLPKLKYIVSEAWLGTSTINIFRALAHEKRGIETLYNEHNCLLHPWAGNMVEQQASLVDKYLTTGWKSKDKKFTSTSSLFKFKSETKQKLKYDILYISYPVEEFAPYYSSNYSTFGTGGINHLKFVKDFFEKLDIEIKSKISYRSYPEDYPLARLSLDKESILSEYLKDVTFVSSYKFKGPNSKEQMASSRLVVIDSISTAYIETLMMNIPTICFWDQKSRFLKEEYSDFCNDLVDAKILHTSAKSAAEHLTAVHENPNDWWNSPKTQKLKNKWLGKNFGKPSKLIDFLLDLNSNSNKSLS